MPIITIDSNKITTEQKKEIIKVFTEKMNQITNVPAQFISVVIREQEDENMGVAGETVCEMKARMQSNV